VWALELGRDILLLKKYTLKIKTYEADKISIVIIFLENIETDTLQSRALNHFAYK